MQRCPRESAPRASASASATAAGGDGAPLLARRCHPATADTQCPHSRGCGTRATWDEYRPGPHNGEVIGECLTTTTRECSRETAFVQQDAVRYMAEQKFTETLMQEAELAESTLEQEEALFQKCMDDIARDMRKIMEDERWLFVSEYLSQKSEQRKLNEDIRPQEVSNVPFSSPGHFFRDRPSKIGRPKDTTAHVRFLFDESLDSRDSVGIHTAECLTQSMCNPRSQTNFMYHQNFDRHYNNLNKLSYVSPPTISTGTKIFEKVNGVNLPSYNYGNNFYNESKRYSGDELDHDSKTCCCKKYDCCICKRNCNRCSPKPDHNIGDYISQYSFRDRWEEDYCRLFSHDKHNFSHDHHSCANHGDYRCPRHGCRTCSPSARPPRPPRSPRPSRTRGPCHCPRPDAKRTQSEKLTLEDVLGLATVDGGCHSEATVSRGRRSCRPGSRRLQGHGVRQRRGEARSLHCSCQRARPEAVDKDTVPCWESPNLKGALASNSNKSNRMERHSDAHHHLGYEDENGLSVSDNRENHSKVITRAEARRFAPDEERRLLVLIEARDALVQEAVEKGRSDQMAAIDSLNKEIRTFVFSRPGGVSLEVSPDQQTDPKVPQSDSADTCTTGNIADDNTDSVQ